MCVQLLATWQALGQWLSLSIVIPGAKLVFLFLSWAKVNWNTSKVSTVDIGATVFLRISYKFSKLTLCTERCIESISKVVQVIPKKNMLVKYVGFKTRRKKSMVLLWPAWKLTWSLYGTDRHEYSAKAGIFHNHDHTWSWYQGQCALRCRRYKHNCVDQSIRESWISILERSSRYVASSLFFASFQCRRDICEMQESWWCKTYHALSFHF